MTLGGNICIRNGNSLDYCWREAIRSLLPVCDQVVVCDGESEDDTQTEIRYWMKHEPKIKLCVYEWPHPKGDIEFWTRWLNYCREHIRSDHQIQLDADEVLSENSYEELLRFKARPAKTKVSLWAKRHNFWRDARHLVPPGVCLSHRVVRVAPQTVWLPSDGPHPMGAEAVGMAQESGLEVFHYGFLRRTEAFFAKARALQEYFFNSYDPRLAAVEELSHVKLAANERQSILSAEQSDQNWMTNPIVSEWINRLVPFRGEHPAIAKPWLAERGYSYD